MQINYIILAHKNPKQVLRLVSTLLGPDVTVYLHLDKKTERTPFEQEIGYPQGLVFIPEKDSHECAWGQRSLIDATLTAMKLIEKEQQEGFVVLLSGQDYPIKSQAYIKDFFERNKKTAFIGNNLFPVSFWKRGGVDRIEKYSFFPTQERKQLKEHKDYINVAPLFHKDFFRKKNLRQALNLLKKMPHKAAYLLKTRRWPAGVSPYGGEHYWAMPFNVMKKVLRFLEENKGYYAFHEHTVLVEEVFFQSIVNSLAKKDSHIKIQDMLTYIDWSRPNPTIPAILELETHYELLLSSASLFARKFDMDRDENILEMLDKNQLKAS